MKVFLSHASPSKPLVRRVAAALPPHVECWLDQDEMGPGQKFPARIEAGIRTGCDFLVVFVDENALDSDWVKREVALGLQRQRDLQRPFVVPVLLGDVHARMHELGLPADEWLYLDARRHDDAALDATGKALRDELFKHASELVERLRVADRRALVDQFAAELTEYEQVAFRWVASMRSPIEVLVGLSAAQDHIRECLDAYNEVGNRFIPRLPLHRDRLIAAWHDRRSLCRHISELIDYVEDDVYRGALYDLNEVLGTLHRNMVADDERRLDPAERAADEARKDALLDKAQRALDRMTRDASELVGDLTSELA